MNKKRFSLQFPDWLKITRPVKVLPGRWHLYEYYTEPGDELDHFTEDTLKERKESLQISFTENQQFIADSNLPASLIDLPGQGNWTISKGVISFAHINQKEPATSFRYAIEKDVLKLLMKDKLGKIEFFGFFRKAIENVP